MASAMLDSIAEFIERNKATSLALIQIVIFESRMLDDFRQALGDKVRSNQSLFSKAKGNVIISAVLS